MPGQDYTKTHRQIVFETIRDYGPLSSYGVFHVARGHGYKMSPSSVRTRLAELRNAGQVKPWGHERTPKGHSVTYIAR